MDPREARIIAAADQLSAAFRDASDLLSQDIDEFWRTFIHAILEMRRELYLEAHRRSRDEGMSFHDALRSVILERIPAACDVEEVIAALEMMQE